MPHSPSSRWSRASRSIVAASLVTGAALLQPVVDPVAAATDSDLCFIVADRGGSNGGDDRLVTFNRVTEDYAAVGSGTGTYNIEAADFWPGNDTLYAIDANKLGSIDLATGEFTAIGGSFGSADGSASSQTISDADGMTFDPLGGFIWASERNRGADYIFQIDPADGSIIRDAFGAGADYVVSTPFKASSPDLDDIAVSPIDGKLYGVANSGSSVPSQLLVEIDRATGDQTLVGPLGEADMEGLSFNPFGQFYGTDGTNNELFDISLATGAATNGRPIPIGADYESVSCLTGTTSTIDGTVYLDADASGSQNAGDIVQPDAIVELIRDLDGDGVIDPNEIVVAESTTDASGDYDFELAALGDFILRINNPSLPDGAVNTTPATIPVTIGALGDTSSPNDFGFFSPPPPPPPPPLSIEKSNNPTGTVAAGDPITYTIDVTNNSAVAQTGIDIQDILPPGVTYTPASTVITLPGAATPQSVLDEFRVKEVYTGGNSPIEGTVAWTDASWTELNDNDDAKDGKIQVKEDSGKCPGAAGGSGTSCLNFNDAQNIDMGVSRSTDLSAAPSATLTLDYFVEKGFKTGDPGDDDIGGEILVQVSADGTTFTTVHTFDGTFGDGASGTINVPIPAAALTSAFAMRLVTNDSDGNGFKDGKYWLDDIKIEWTPPSTTAGGPPPDVLSTLATAPTLQPGETISVTFDVTVDTPTAVPFLQNTAEATSTQQPDPIVDTATNQVQVATVDLELTKEIVPAAPAAGDSVTYVVTLTNKGPSVATDVVVQETPPAALTSATFLPAAGSSFGTNTNQWNVLQLGVDESTTLTLIGAIAGGGDYSNTAEVIAATQPDADSTPNDGSGDDFATVPVTVPLTADLSVEKTLTGGPSFFPAEGVSFDIVVTNDGPDTATNIVVSDVVPAVVTGATGSTATGSFTAPNWTIPSLASGSSATLTISGAADLSYGSFTNVAEITASDQFDPDSTVDNNDLAEDDQDSVDFQIVPRDADLAVTKVADKTTVEIGEVVNFTISVTNNGPDPATNIEIAEALPAEFSDDSIVVESLGVYAISIDTWFIDTLTVGQTATLSIAAEPISAGTPTNTASVQALDQNDPVSGNDSDDVALTLNPIVDSDFDGIPDRLDIDDDNDGITDVNEIGPDSNNPLDTDGDSLPDYLDIDADGDGVPDNVEAQGTGIYVAPSGDDIDDDGLDDAYDDDTDSVDPVDSVGIDPDDFDGDLRPNHLDIDADDDGITDLVESFGTIVPVNGDADLDGLDDAYDTIDNSAGGDPAGNPAGGTLPGNLDGTGGANYLDIDADDDGITDLVESHATGSVVLPSGDDDDNDGLDDAYDDDTLSTDPIDSVGTDPENTDTTGAPDYLDIDADDDGIPDNIESQPTLGYAAPSGLDDDGDGLDNVYDVDDGDRDAAASAGTDPENTDTDATPDYRDGDSDNDGSPDAAEGGRGTIENADDDGDGLDNGFDHVVGPDVNDDIADPATDLPDTDNDVLTDDVDYRDVPPAIVGDRVWLDLDDDGLQETGEDGIPGVTVQLLDAAGTTVLDTTVTGADGAYSFSTTAFTDYRVRVVYPGAIFSPRDTGSDDTVDSDVDGTGTTLTFTAGPGPNPELGDAGVRPASIGDLVFVDLDDDGVQDAGELGVAGVDVELRTIGGAVLDTATTGSDGTYQFDGLVPGGDYVVAVIAPAGASFTVQDALNGGSNDDSVDSDVAGSGLTDTINPVSGDNFDVADAGIAAPTVGDFVWLDADDDGEQDAGEPGLPGLTVQLLDATGTTVIESTTTDGSGNYEFVVPDFTQDYVVRVIPPTGGTFTSGPESVVDGAGEVLVSPLPGPNDAIDAGVRAASIGDFVFVDLDDDGMQDAGEPGVAGVTVQLWTTGGALLDTETTDSNGRYSFDGVVPGADYVVVVVAPTGSSFTTRDVGGDDAVDSDVFPSGSSAAITPMSGDNFDVGDAGIMAPTIGDFVWLDSDNDGVQDPGEPGLFGVTVELLDATGTTVLDSTTTDGSGVYSFVVPDFTENYVVRVAPLPATMFTSGPESVVDSDGDVLVSPLPGPNNDVDAGLIPKPTLSGSVLDENGDPIQGVTITIEDGAAFSTTALTQADGTYGFTDLDPGTYTVTEAQPAGFGDVSTSAGSAGGDDATENVVSGITLVPGDVASGYDFVEGYSSIAGTVYEDLDDDGEQDPGEPGLVGVDVTLTGTDVNGAIAPVTVVTDSDGDYLFGDLLSGTYVVTEPTQPSGLLDGTDAPGSVGGTAVNPGDEINSITLPVGTDAVGYDFGEIRPASISGNVSDENGAPIENVTVTLTGVDDLGVTITPIAITTDGDGDYTFTNLRPGAYTVTETQPAGFGEGGESSDDGGATISTNTIADLTLVAGGTNADNDFVETYSSIAGHVFIDVDDDGVYDLGLDVPLAGETVTLIGTDLNGAVGPVTATTNASGVWVVDDLLAGTYDVAETQPTGYADGQDSVGSEGGTLGNDVVTSIGLPAGTDAIDYDFGEVPAAAITGNVSDEHGDPLENVAVTLTGVDSFSNPVAAVVVTTDVDGDFVFDELAPGAYTVTETQPAGFGDVSTTAGSAGGDDSVTNVVSGIVLATTTAAAGYDFVEGYGSIAGVVFVDENNDGLRQPAEPVLENVNVTLSGTDPNGAVGPVTVQTLADGSYLFGDLLSGDYTVTEVTPSGFLDGTDIVGSTGGTAVNPGDEINSVTLAAGEDATGYDFGEIRPGSASGNVSDDNGDPIENVTLTLTGTDDRGPITPIAVTTDADGDYTFGDLRPGTYTVTESQPAGFGDVSTTAGSAGGDDSVQNVVSGVVLDPGESATGYNFIEGYGSIAGEVFDDVNNDGVRQAAEPGLGNVGVTLAGTDVNGAIAPVTIQTQSDGSYVFHDLLAGDYTVTEVTPLGFLDGTDTPGTAGGAAVNPGDEINAITVGAGEDATGYDFGEVRPGSISGNVSDENGDPIENVTVTLTGVDDRGAIAPIVVTTDADGDYSFGDLRPGTYAVTESQPAGFGAGSSSSDDSGATTGANVISDLTLTVGGSNASNDFVDTYGSIAGVVFVDENHDGVRQPAEPVLEDVDVTLTGTDVNGAVAPVTVQTMADGSYLFDDLLSGDYTVTEVTPAGYLDGTDIVGSTGGTAVNPGDEINSITLGAGEDATGYDFGEVRPGSISGNVSDENGDPIENVTVTLTGVDDRGAIAPVVVTTGVDGDYTFPDLRPGSFTVTESQPAGFGDVSTTAGSAGGDDSVQNVVSGVVLDPGESATGFDFVEGYSSISGQVFIDVDADGVYDVGLDVPLEGQTITLTGTDPNGVVGPVSVTTNAAGEWTFEDLLAGTYDVNETQPSGYADGLDSVGSEGGTLGNDVVTGIVLPVGVDAVDYAFGEVPEASIAGNVSDENGDPIGSVTVTLTGVDSFGTTVAPVVVTTDVDGDFVFDELASGTYTVTESQPAGFADVSTSAGTAGGGDSVENVVSGIALGNTTTAQNYDFVEGYSSIAGTVYEDLDDDGVQDPGEPGLAGVDVTLTGTDPDGAITPVTVQTLADGSYLFDDLLSGDYTLAEPTQPAALLDGTDAAGTAGGTAVNPGDEINTIALPVGTDAVGYDFGEIHPGSISGNVSDENGNPLDAVELTLTGIDDLGAAITPIVVATDVDGRYTFSDLRPGTYTVTQTQPPSYGDGSQTSPTGDVSVVNVISSITIVAGDSAADNDFVETLSSIRGTVYLDIGENGVFDAGDPRLSGVTVHLDGVDENGAIAQVVAVTDVDGAYRFDDLLAGTYVITEETPAEFNDGTDAAGSVGGTAVNPGDEINSIPLPAGTDAAGYDFGEVGTIITGTVFVDDDRDGSIGEGEDVRLDGIEIALLNSSGNEVATTTTDADGTYLFADLAAGEYTVAQFQPDGYGSTTANRIDVDVPNVGLTQVDFGEDLGSIGDFVFADLDGDGQQGADEPGAEGVTVRLLDSVGDVMAVTTSDSDGLYEFARLFPETYTLEFSMVEGSSLTEDGQGSAEVDSDPDWVTGETPAITISIDRTSGLLDRHDDIDAGVVDEVIDLSVTLAIDRETAAVGDQVTYTLTPSNDSIVPVVGGAKVVFELPPAVTVDAIEAPGWSVQVVGNTATFTFDQVLLPGDSLPIIRVAAAVVDGSASATAEVAIGTVDGSVEVTLSNNSAVAAFTVPAPQQPSNLPTTGSDLGSRLVPYAIALVLAGIVLQIGARRRRGDRNGRTPRPA